MVCQPYTRRGKGRRSILCKAQTKWYLQQPYCVLAKIPNTFSFLVGLGIIWAKLTQVINHKKSPSSPLHKTRNLIGGFLSHVHLAFDSVNYWPTRSDFSADPSCVLRSRRYITLLQKVPETVANSDKFRKEKLFYHHTIPYEDQI